MKYRPDRVRQMEDEIARLRSIMAAAADEIEAHWEAHCDGDGFGPVNLVRRLRTGQGDYRTTGWLREEPTVTEALDAGQDALLAASGVCEVSDER